MNIDNDSLSIVWGYSDWESQLFLRLVEPRVAGKWIDLGQATTNCRGETFRKYNCRWGGGVPAYKKVEDLHCFCNHRQIRDAARLYSGAEIEDYRTVVMDCGKYKLYRLPDIDNNAFLQKYMEVQPSSDKYSSVHELLCARIQDPPDVLRFGKHRNKRYTDLPDDYLAWCTAKVNIVDATAANRERKRRACSITDYNPYSNIFPPAFLFAFE